MKECMDKWKKPFINLLEEEIDEFLRHAEVCDYHAGVRDAHIEKTTSLLRPLFAQIAPPRFVSERKNKISAHKNLASLASEAVDHFAKFFKRLFVPGEYSRDTVQELPYLRFAPLFGMVVAFGFAAYGLGFYLEKIKLVGKYSGNRPPLFQIFGNNNVQPSFKLDSCRRLCEAANNRTDDFLPTGFNPPTGQSKKSRRPRFFVMKPRYIGNDQTAKSEKLPLAVPAEKKILNEAATATLTRREKDIEESQPLVRPRIYESVKIIIGSPSQQPAVKGIEAIATGKDSFLQQDCSTLKRKE